LIKHKDALRSLKKNPL